MKANSIEEYFGTLLQASVETHKAHLMADKLNAHLALDEVYGSLQWRSDAIIEKYQGLHGKVKEYKSVLSLDGKSNEEYLNELREFVESGKELIKETEIHSLIDEVLGSIDSALYKLKELKEGRNPFGGKLNENNMAYLVKETIKRVMKEAKEMTPTEKIAAWKNGDRDENVKACAPDKLRQYHKLAKNMGFEAGAKEIEDVAASKGVKLEEDALVEMIKYTVSRMTEAYGESSTPYKDMFHNYIEENMSDAQGKQLAMQLVYWLNDDRDAKKFMEANQIPFEPEEEEGLEQEAAMAPAAPDGEEQIIQDDFNAPKPDYFRGVEGVEMIWHGEWSDPELRYDGYVANYWKVEDALYADCKQDEAYGPGVADSEDGFNKYCQEHRNDVIEYVMTFGKKEGEEVPEETQEGPID